jgi:hypothetical protein
MGRLTACRHYWSTEMIQVQRRLNEDSMTTVIYPNCDPVRHARNFFQRSAPSVVPGEGLAPLLLQPRGFFLGRLNFATLAPQRAARWSWLGRGSNRTC